MSVHVAIGNSDDRLSQAEWADYYRRVDHEIRRHAETVHGAWVSLPTAPWQNACWAFDVSDGVEGFPRDGLREALTAIARGFRQDSVAWSEVETEFLTTGR